LSAWPKSGPEGRGSRLGAAVLTAALAAWPAGPVSAGAPFPPSVAVFADTADTSDAATVVPNPGSGREAGGPDSLKTAAFPQAPATAASAAPDTVRNAAPAFPAEGAASSIGVGGREPVETKSPKGALLRSALIPGWGQWYNGSRWKAGLVIAAGAGLAADIAWQNRRAAESADDAEKQFYVNNRSLAAWWLAGLYALTLVDAYVDAQLWHFDTGPEPGWGAAGVRMSLQF
jgi:hypothetical protein